MKQEVDIADLIAGELKVSRATAYDMMYCALWESHHIGEKIEKAYAAGYSNGVDEGYAAGKAYQANQIK